MKPGVVGSILSPPRDTIAHIPPWVSRGYDEPGPDWPGAILVGLAVAAPSFLAWLLLGVLRLGAL